MVTKPALDKLAKAELDKAAAEAEAAEVTAKAAADEEVMAFSTAGPETPYLTAEQELTHQSFGVGEGFGIGKGFV
jgi:hypothetical protein